MTTRTSKHLAKFQFLEHNWIDFGKTRLKTLKGWNGRKRTAMEKSWHQFDSNDVTKEMFWTVAKYMVLLAWFSGKICLQKVGFRIIRSLKQPYEICFHEKFNIPYGKIDLKIQKSHLLSLDVHGKNFQRGFV